MERDREEILDLIVRWEEAKAQGQDLGRRSSAGNARPAQRVPSSGREVGEVAWLNGPIEADSRSPAVARR